MLVVTSGARYIDIDAYACAVAYAELLNSLGHNVIAASSAIWNESITDSLRALEAPFLTDYIPKNNDDFALVDVSDPAHFDAFVRLENVVEVFDHHPGFENFWHQKLGDKSHIEFVGAAATLIYEEWAGAHKLDEISSVSARLLAAAILDNTLNFNASITTQRDKDAYDVLVQHAHLPADFAANYFSECQAAITADLQKALANDTKFLAFPGLSQELCFGQMVVWNAKDILSKEGKLVTQIMSGMSKQWLLNLVSIAERKSYFLTDNSDVQAWLAKLLNLNFQENFAVADKLWLRKEVMKAAL